MTYVQAIRQLPLPAAIGGIDRAENSWWTVAPLRQAGERIIFRTTPIEAPHWTQAMYYVSRMNLVSWDAESTMRGTWDWVEPLPKELRVVEGL